VTYGLDETKLAGMLTAYAEATTTTRKAAVVLLVANGTWLRHPGFRRYCSSSENFAKIMWSKAIGALDAGYLVASPSDEAILRVAASLAAGVPVDLNSALEHMTPADLRIAASALAGYVETRAAEIPPPAAAP
jgi:hypothetical protein